MTLFQTHKTTSTFDFCFHLTTSNARSSQNHLPGPECAMISHASNFFEIVYPIHLPNLSCELLLLLQISDATHSLPSTLRSLLSQGKLSTVALLPKCYTAHVRMHYNSQLSHILSSLARKFFMGKNYLSLRWCLPSSCKC